MQKFTYTALSSEGKPILGASVSVYIGGTSTLAALYQDDGVTAKTNPLSTNANGFAQAKIADGTYDIETSYGAVSQRVDGFVAISS